MTDKLKFLYRKIILPSCLIFTLLCLIFSAMLSWSKTELSVPTINIDNLLQILLFSVAISFSNLIFGTGLKFFAKIVLHCLCFLASVSVVFFLIGRHVGSFRSAVAVLAVFAAIYVVIAVICGTVRAVILKKKQDNQEYKRQF